MSLQGDTETETGRGLWDKNSGGSKTRLNSVLGSCDHTIVTSHHLFIITYNPGFSLTPKLWVPIRKYHFSEKKKKIKYIFLDSRWGRRGRWKKVGSEGSWGFSVVWPNVIKASTMQRWKVWNSDFHIVVLSWILKISSLGRQQVFNKSLQAVLNN